LLNYLKQAWVSLDQQAFPKAQVDRVESVVPADQVAQEGLVDPPLLLRLHCLSLLKLPENSPLDLPVQRSKVLIHIYVLFCFHATVVDVVVDVDVDVVIRYLHLPHIKVLLHCSSAGYGFCN
jgi:hypothetical protein